MRYEDVGDVVDLVLLEDEPELLEEADVVDSVVLDDEIGVVDSVLLDELSVLLEYVAVVDSIVLEDDIVGVNKRVLLDELSVLLEVERREEVEEAEEVVGSVLPEDDVDVGIVDESVLVSDIDRLDVLVILLELAEELSPEVVEAISVVVVVGSADDVVTDNDVIEDVDVNKEVDDAPGQLKQPIS